MNATPESTAPTLAAPPHPLMPGVILFAFCLGLGSVAVIGGVLVYIEPFEDVRAKMAVMALVFALHGLVQIALALKVRLGAPIGPREGNAPSPDKELP